MSQIQGDNSLYVKFFCPNGMITVNFEEYVSKLCHRCTYNKFKVIEECGLPFAPKEFVVAFQHSG